MFNKKTLYMVVATTILLCSLVSLTDGNYLFAASGFIISVLNYYTGLKLINKEE